MTTATTTAMAIELVTCTDIQRVQLPNSAGTQLMVDEANALN
jgi:hypothetical protein